MSNQASEDELRLILEQSFRHVAYNMIATLPIEVKYLYATKGLPLHYEKELNYTKDAILKFLRTEKLKLLAEVRERAIPNPTTPAGENEFVPLEVLTKLEAEL